MPAAERQFRVHAADAGHRARVITEPSFEAAAIAYAEDWPHSIDDNPAIRVIVHDLENGHEHCFVVDLDSGETSDCA